MFGESRDTETIFTFKEKLKIECYNFVLNKLMSEMQSGKEAYGVVREFLHHTR